MKANTPKEDTTDTATDELLVEWENADLLADQKIEDVWQDEWEEEPDLTQLWDKTPIATPRVTYTRNPNGQLTPSN